MVVTTTTENTTTANTIVNNVPYPVWIIKLKYSIRPVLTYLFTFLYIYVFFFREDMEEVYIGGLNTIMVTIIVFWFGEKLLTNVGVVDFLRDFSSNARKEKTIIKEEIKPLENENKDGDKTRS